MESLLTIQNLVFLILAYLLGSIPTSVWIGKFFYNIDVREHGSKNAGATNTMRLLGKTPGIIVLIIDILKGFVAVKMLLLSSELQPETIFFVNMQLTLCVAALLGHIFPVFAQFNGGKGIATLLGAMLAMNTEAALISIVIFLVVLLVFRYVSLGSMIGALFYPVYTIFIQQSTIPSLIVFSIIIALGVLFTHQKNIERLLKHEEKKVFSKKEFKRKNT
jgi:glycerol-3-phosphate acyltransferase PlsY